MKKIEILLIICNNIITNKMNTSVNSKLVTLFDERGEEYMPQSKYKIKYIFNIVKGNCYKLKIKLIYGELIDMNIVLLFDKLVKIKYNNNFIKIKTLCYNQFEEHTLLNYVLENLDGKQN